MTMKKLILTFGIFLGGICLVNAQSTAAAATNPSEKIIAHLTTVCAITNEQIVKIKPIAKAVVNARQANQKKYAGNPDGLKAANKSVNEDFKNQLKTILTKDQMEKLNADMAQHKAAQQANSSAPKSK